MTNAEEASTQKAKHAGSKEWYQRWWVWLLIVVAAALIGWFIVGGAKKDDSVEQSGNTAEAQSEEAVLEEGEADSETGDDNEVAPEDDPADSEESDFPSFDPFEQRGDGDEALTGLNFDKPGAVSFDCPECEGPVQLSTHAKAGSPDAVLIDDEGPIGGTFMIGTEGDAITAFTIKAEGEWSIRVQDLNEVPVFEEPTDGIGSNVFVYRGPALSAGFTGDGEGSFIVRTYPAKPSVLIDEDAPLDKVIDILEGAFAIETTGEWSFEPR